jgi:stage IV sporulation protein FB
MYSAKLSWSSDNLKVLNLLGLVLLIFLLPLRWLAAVILAACIHELGHYIAVHLCGGNVHSFHLGSSGAVMHASGLTTYQEILCLLAGPLVGLLPLLLYRTLPAVALCGLIQTLYNLLPVYPLDGGKILHNIILICGGSNRLYIALEHSFLLLAVIACIYLYLRFGILLLFFAVPLIFRKTPCKEPLD